MSDDGKRQCLVAYLQNPASGGFPREALLNDGGGPPAKVRRVCEVGSATADTEAPAAAFATPMEATPTKDTPTNAPPMQTCTPQRSPALLLATSVHSTGTPRIQLSPGPAEADERWWQGPWSRSLRQSVAVTCLCAQADKKAVGRYKSSGGEFHAPTWFSER